MTDKKIHHRTSDEVVVSGELSKVVVDWGRVAYMVIAHNNPYAELLLLQPNHDVIDRVLVARAHEFEERVIAKYRQKAEEQSRKASETVAKNKQVRDGWVKKLGRNGRIKAILGDFSSGMKYSEIANKYGISNSRAREIVVAKCRREWELEGCLRNPTLHELRGISTIVVGEL